MSAPIPYITRVRDYYAALGFPVPYVWAQNDPVAFHPLTKPLSQMRVGIVTSAALGTGAGRGPLAYAADAKFFAVYRAALDPLPPLRIDHVAIDFDHADPSDPGSFFPGKALQEAQAQGRIAAAAPVFYGLPTRRSQRETREELCPNLVAMALEDGIEAMLLLPNCPVCHQSACLAAQALETAGIPTVVMASALDLVTHVGAPRVLFSDTPLGSSAGRPHDPESQRQTLSAALDLLETATIPRTIRQSPLTWSDSDDWKQDYSNPARLSAAEIARRRAAFDAAKTIAKEVSAKV